MGSRLRACRLANLRRHDVGSQALSALDITSVVGIHTDFFADVDERRHLNADPCFERCRLEAGGGRRILDARLGIDDLEDYRRRQLNSNRAPIVKIDFDLQVGE